MRRGASRLVALVVALVLVGAAPAGALVGTPLPADPTVDPTAEPTAEPTVDPIVEEVQRCVDVIVDSAQDGALVDRITGELCNRAPVADAGDDADIQIGDLVVLDGTGSADPDGDDITFAWNLAAPDGSEADLDDAASASPSFTPDRHGTYTATLVVHDGRTASEPDSAVFTVVNRRPDANAGPDLVVRADEVAVLDGTASSDPDGDELAYSWTLVDAPEGSSAAITDATDEFASLVPDALGDYAVELTVSDGDLSATDTAVVTATHVTAIALSPSVLHTTTFDTKALRVELDRPAAAGGRVVLLSSDAPDLASVPSEVTIPAGETGAEVPVDTDLASGTATITATSERAISGQAVVEVSLRSLTITLEDGLVGIERSVDGAVTLGAPAPAGGVVVSLSSSDPSRVSVAPEQVTVPEGETVAPFAVTGVSEGSVVLRATAPGHADAEATTAGTDAVVSIGGVAPMSPGESRSLPISLTRAAPPGGVTVTLVSSDPSIASVPGSVTIAQGQFLPTANPQVTGHRVGTVTVTARTQGYAPDDRPVTVRLILTLSPSSKRVVVDRTSAMTIALSGPAAPGTGTTVALVSADPTRATVPATVMVPAGQTTASFGVTGVSVGSTAVTASTEGAADVTATVHVDPTPPINAPNVAVGVDLQIQHFLNLTASPDGPTTITVTVADPSKALLSTSQTSGGSASITFPNVTTTASRSFFVQGIGLGATTYTVSAPGNQSTTRTVDVTRSGVAIFNGSTLSTTTFSPDVLLDLRTIRLNASNQYAGEQEPRAGRSVSVPVTSSNTTVGTITTSPVIFVAGVGSAGWLRNTHFDPANAGITTVALTQPAGFTAPANVTTSVAVTVTAPPISAGPVNVGVDLQVPATVALSQNPPSPVDLTVTVADPSKAIVSGSRTAAGADSITFTDVGSSTGLSRVVYVQGLGLGTTTYTVSAPGYQAFTQSITVTPAGVAFFSGPTLNTTTFSPNQVLDLRTIRLNTSNQYAGEQEPRHGAPISVDVTSSNTTVGTLTVSPVTFTAGVGSAGWLRNTHFDPANAGTTTVALTQPPGFTTPANVPTSVAVTVTAPPILAQHVGVGIDLQVPIFVSLSQNPPSPVDLTVTVADSSKAVVSASRTAAGAASVTFTNVAAGNLGRTVQFQGLALGTTTYTVSAPGYQTNTYNLEVTRAGVAFFSGPTINTTTFSPNVTLDLRTMRLNAANQYAGEQEPRHGAPIDVTVESDNISVGTITMSPVEFRAGVGTAGWLRNTHFDPATAGTTTITLTQPPGFTAPVNVTTSVATTVRPPNIILTNADVGRDLQNPVFVSLEVAPPEPVDVTITIASPALAVLSRVRTAVGTNTVTFENVTGTSVGTMYLQGLQFGTTTLLSQAAGYADRSTPVSVTDAGVAIFMGSFSVAAGAPNVNIDVRTIRLSAAGSYAGEQEPRPGAPVSVEVTSSNPAVGEVTNSPLVFTAGSGPGWLRHAVFDPHAAGQTTISVVQPPGYRTPTSTTTITATVT